MPIHHKSCYTAYSKSESLKPSYYRRTLKELSEIETQIIPLIESMNLFERNRKLFEELYRQAFRNHELGQATQLEKAVVETMKTIKALKTTLSSLNRKYHALQRSLIY